MKKEVINESVSRRSGVPKRRGVLLACNGHTDANPDAPSRLVRFLCGFGHVLSRRNCILSLRYVSGINYIYI
jgi:hypothetical protein